MPGGTIGLAFQETFYAGKYSSFEKTPARGLTGKAA